MTNQVFRHRWICQNVKSDQSHSLFSVSNFQLRFSIGDENIKEKLKEIQFLLYNLSTIGGNDLEDIIALDLLILSEK